MKNLSGFIDKNRVMTHAALMLFTFVACVWGGGAIAGETQYRLDVTYTNGAIIFGPLSFGLTALPDSVTARFILGPGELNTPEPGQPEKIYFDEGDALFGRITFGDASWPLGQLEELEMEYNIDDQEVTELSYNYSAINTPTAQGPILNPPLTITGTDKDTGEVFKYIYATRTPTLSPLPITVVIDIKPDDEPNCFNTNGHGVIPVAILGSGDFDVSQVDTATLSFGGLAVRVRGNKGALCSTVYLNEDEYLDLVCQFEDDAANWEVGNGEASLTGSLYDGIPFEGADSICVVP